MCKKSSTEGHACLDAGDSRAVLCRGGAAIALTDDHKAAREDETVGLLFPRYCCQ